MSVKLRTQLVKPSFSLVLCQEQKSLIDYILDELKGVKIDGMKLDIDLLKYIAEIIENQIPKKAKHDKDSSPNKMEILIEIWKKLFPNSSQVEIDQAKSIVEYLLKHKMVIKTKLSKVMIFYLKKRFLI